MAVGIVVVLEAGPQIVGLVAQIVVVVVEGAVAEQIVAVGVEVGVADGRLLPLPLDPLGTDWD